MKESKETPSTPLPIHDVDEIFDRTSHYGRYQLFMLLVIQYLMMNAAGNYVFISFASLKPICGDSSIRTSDACELMSECPANATEVLFASLYDGDIVCPHSHLPQHLQTIQAVGSGFGAILAGHIADYYGRKWVTYSGAVQMTLFGFMGAFALSWHMLAFAMLGMGFSYGVLIDASMTLACETAGKKYRIVQTLAFQWSLALQVASLCAYLTGSWRGYLFTVNALSLPALALMLLWVESPRWLIQKKRYDEAVRNINRISRCNGCETMFCASDLLPIKVTEEHRTTFFWIGALVSTRKFLAYSFVMFTSALTVEMCVAVIIFDVQVLAGNPFLNVALYGILRLWVPLFIVLLEANAKWFGRRTLFISSQCLTVMCFASVIILSLFPPTQSVTVLRTCLAMLGGIINSSIFFTVYKQYVMELYPTVIRALAVGAFGVVERIGGAIAPQLVNMNRWAWAESAVAITTTVVFISLLSGWAILPETRNSSIPDVLELDQKKRLSRSCTK
ncbi:Solute carrier family 22 member 4 [Toxocara canis]|uniref:Solute carrier family 22 member 4 n=1 Tax=Toxocara canis TaxID=6265 RepID=A0A0B2UWP9_TOXCA|nr:Solute carrier family 22 member 4 [Toxocara canis]